MSNKKPRLEDDFYNYINYDYFKKTKIPKGHSRWASYYQLSDENKKKLKKLIIDSERDISSDEMKLVYNYYDLIMDIKRRNKIGITPAKELLKRINDFKDLSELTDLYLYYSKEAFESFLFSFGIYPDAKDSNKNILYLESSGLILGERDYYFDDDERTKKIRKAYFEYLGKMLKIYGYQNIDKMINDTFEIEYEMAKNILKREEYRDPYVLYNITKIKDLKKDFDLLDWETILKELGITKQTTLSIAELKYFKNLKEVLSKFTFEQIKNYLVTVLTIEIGGSGLTTKIAKINFEFSKVFTGIKKQKPMKDRAYDSVESLLGDAIGKKFVEKWFPEESKNEVLDMTKQMIKEYEIMINENKWLSKKAKEKAIIKLKGLKIKIGYPDKWKDYSKLDIKSPQDGETLFNASIEISRWGFNKAIEELNKPVDKEKWFMNAQTVNAYYNPSSNEICFPAGILQKPFYSKEFEMEKKWAAIGAVIGHEISHAFDDEGCEFDEKGNLNKWWTEDDYKNYEEKSKKLEEQFSNYKMFDTNINGKLTLGENIADLVGLTVAMRVGKKSKENFDYKLFFSYFAEAERVLSKRDALLSQIKSDPHSPSEFRVNGVLVNINEFHEAFNTKENDKMFKPKDDQIRIF